MSTVSDQDFMAYANNFEKEEQERRSKTGGGFTPQYEEIKWTGLEPQKTKIIRALGGNPAKPQDRTDGRIVQIAWIKGDDGKNFRCVLPSKEGSDHIMWRVINRVKEVAYVNRKRIFVNETKHQELFDMVVHNKIPEGDPKRRYNRGWEGRNVVVMNVIDREQMDWHRENKHSMLLSRNVSEGANGNVFIDEGVPVYGFFNQIVSTLFGNYGNWNNYDMGITRLGTQQTPYRIINATAYAAGKIPELPAGMVPFVSLDLLTEEEDGWEKYDLAKIFGTTSYTKISNKLGIAFQTIDARLGTNFYTELQEFVEAEKAERAARTAEKAEAAPAEATVTPTEVAAPAVETPKVETPVVESAPVTRRVAVVDTPVTAGLSADKLAVLKGYEKLDEASRATIIDVKMSGDRVTDIMYDTTDGLVACPDCKVASPESFVACPHCGLDFV